MTTAWRFGESDGVILDIRVQPGAARAQVGGLWVEPEGGARLIVRVTPPPEDGKANRAVLVALAQSLRVPKSALALASGEKGRHKTVRINGDAAALGSKIDDMAQSRGPNK